MPPLTPVYVMERANETIELASNTPLQINYDNCVYEGSADIRLDFLPKPSLLITASFGVDAIIVLESIKPGAYKIRLTEFQVTLDAIPTLIAPQPSTSPPLQITFVPKNGSLHLGDFKSKNLKRVISHLVNFPKFYCNLRKSSQGCWRTTEDEGGIRRQFQPTLELVLRNWKITIEPILSLDRMLRELETTGGYGITHVVELIRKDGKEFTATQASNVLEALHYFLSFVRGAWTQILLPVGCEQGGQRVWQRFGVDYVDAWQNIESWFYLREGHVLNKLFGGFWRLWRNKDLNYHLRNVIYWYLMSNRQSSDAAIILTQAGLELSSWMYMKMNSKKSEGKAAEKIRELLDDDIHKIPLIIPVQLGQLMSVPQPKQNPKKPIPFDGPYVFTTVRNEIVHPDNPNRGQVDNAKPNTWRLGQWYLELVLLRFFGYMGFYQNRTQSGKKEKVPWA